MRLNLSLYLVSLFLVSFQVVPSFAQGKGSGQVLQVITAPVIKTNFADHIEALGTALANETVVITADTTEKVNAIHFEDGQVVEKGQLLITLDKSEEDAQLSAAKARLSEAQSSYNRALGLQKTNALSKATLQQRLASLKEAQSEIEGIQSRIDELTITAPFAGILGLREVSVGALVRPGDKITTIDDLSQIKIDFEVPSVFLSSLKPGLPIIGKVDAYKDKEFSGEVQTINARVDPVTRTVRVRAIIPNSEILLKPGLLMTITLLKDQRDALLIPEESLLKREEKNFVFVISEEDGKMLAHEREIIIGARQPGQIEIVKGLSAGERVVAHGTSKVRDGMEIEILASEENDETLDELLKKSEQENKDSGG